MINELKTRIRDGIYIGAFFVTVIVITVIGLYVVGSLANMYDDYKGELICQELQAANPSLEYRFDKLTGCKVKQDGIFIKVD